jgi:hypothetical protein
LLKAACHWWLSHQDTPIQGWVEALLAERTMQYRLKEIWNGLSQEEQQALAEAQAPAEGKVSSKPKPRDNNRSVQDSEEADHRTLQRLAAKGLGQPAEDGWRLSSGLLSAFVAQAGGRSRGRLRFDQNANLIFQGQLPLENLAPLESSLLKFLVTHPRIRHTYTELIEAAWPADIHREGVSTEALYQLVRGLRRQIEPAPSQPRYIVNWRGRPEGGYQCFPEGRPSP